MCTKENLIKILKDGKVKKQFKKKPLDVNQKKRKNSESSKNNLSGVEKYKIYVHVWDQDDI